jgi:NAD(P)-dependent dehydrogenase (short-subunit alcohol dehydrogenase family)
MIKRGIPGEFVNKVAIVTGGSGGIGAAVAHALVREGVRTFIVGRHSLTVQKTVRAIKRASGAGCISGLVGDVSCETDVKRVTQAVLRSHGRIDILVNAAAIQSPIGPFASTRWRDWRSNVEVNLLGTALMCHAVIAAMVRRSTGTIVNFSGGGATSSRPNFSAYAVSKAAVVRFTEILADEVRSQGIRVNAIAPGAIKTRMLAQIIAAGASAGEKEVAAVRRIIESGGDSLEDAVRLVLFLVSEKSKGFSGRLVSAVWDPWKKWSPRSISKIMSGELYTLRRKT